MCTRECVAFFFLIRSVVKSSQSSLRMNFYFSYQRFVGGGGIGNGGLVLLCSEAWGSFFSIVLLVCLLAILQNISVYVKKYIYMYTRYR